MLVAAQADLTGWWIGYAIGGVVVVVVAALALILIATARKIAAVAEDATRSLALARDRTEVLWKVATTNEAAAAILAAARQARAALGGGNGADVALAGTDTSATTLGTRKGLGGPASGLAGENPPQHPSGHEG